MKWKIIKNAVLSAAFCSLFMIGTSQAYFTDSHVCVNTTFAGGNTSKIEEDFPHSDPKPLDQNPEYQKKVWVENKTSGVPGQQVDCYVRVSLSYSNYDVAEGLTLHDLNTTEWIYDTQTGYYYYKYPLKEGECTKPLFDGFHIDYAYTTDTCKEGVKDFYIQVYEESVQAEGFADYQTAWNYYLNPAKAT